MKIIIAPSAQKSLKKLDKPIKKQIIEYLESVEKLENLRSKGKGLTANLSGLWRYRVGDYRIISRILDKDLIILAVEVRHRKEVYD